MEVGDFELRNQFVEIFIREIH